MPVKEPTPGYALRGTSSGSGCFGVKCLFLAENRFPVYKSQNALTCLCTLPIAVNHFVLLSVSMCFFYLFGSFIQLLLIYSVYSVCVCVCVSTVSSLPCTICILQFRLSFMSYLIFPLCFITHCTITHFVWAR
jgi:hypothetical protein